MLNSNPDQMMPRVVSDLKKRSTHGIIFYFVAIIVILCVNGFYVRHPVFSQLLALSVGAICIFRLIHLLVYKWVPRKHATLNQSIFFLSIAATALIWGIFYAQCMTFEGEYPTILLIAICTTGLSAGGVVAYLPSLRLAIAFNLCMLMPAVFLMALRNIYMPMALLITTFSAYLVLMAFRANREYSNALRNEILLMKQSEELKALSRIDVLTGLYNRRYFDERFALAWKLSTRHRLPLSLIICDIDHFKRINDVHGHLAGDEFLKLTAKTLTEVFKRDTDLVARYGGEEFVILISDTDAGTVHSMAEMIRKRMEDLSLAYNSKDIKTTVSIGIASVVPVQTQGQDALMLMADQALYRAKQEGRNRTVACEDRLENAALRASEQGDGRRA
jgi:diguanylate cyclase (GGDEF)-like protein